LSEETLLEFPCAFPLKVMGLNQPAFEQYVVEIVRIHAGSAAISKINTRATATDAISQ
jgi:hypothetical protein